MKLSNILPVRAALGALALAASLIGAPPRFSTIFTFADGWPGGLSAANGALYVPVSGDNNCGSIVRLEPPTSRGGAWTERVLYSFAATGDGCGPGYGPIIRPDGVIYGLTTMGGAYGFGAVYELRPPPTAGGAWTESVLFSFGQPGTLEGSPRGNLIPTADGFFLLTDGGLFHLVPSAGGGTWNGRLLYLFFPFGANSLTMDANGIFYGTIPVGGSAPGQLGEVFRLAPPAAPGGGWTKSVIHSFGYGGAFAGNPDSLTIASDGTIYGTTFGAGCCGGGTGTVFQLTPPVSPGGAWGYEVLKVFENHPNLPLLLRNGNLYGAAETFDSDGGTVFELMPPSAQGGEWTVVFLHDFLSNGQTPNGLLVDGRGVLYGSTATLARNPPTGTIYRIFTQ